MKVNGCNNLQNVLAFVVIAGIMLILMSRNTTESFVSVVPAQPSKCFNCERELPDRKKYLSGPSKCFSCEQDILQRSIDSRPGLAQPTKCFSCEKQLNN